MESGKRLSEFSAATDAPLFRLCLSIAIVWLVGVGSFFIFGDWFTEQVRATADRRLGCQSDNLFICGAVLRGMKSDWELFWYGRPLWNAAKFLIAPPVLLLMLAAYGSSILAYLKRRISAWQSWIRSGSSQ